MRLSNSELSKCPLLLPLAFGAMTKDFRVPVVTDPVAACEIKVASVEMPEVRPRRC